MRFLGISGGLTSDLLGFRARSACGRFGFGAKGLHRRMRFLGISGGLAADLLGFRACGACGRFTLCADCLEFGFRLLRRRERAAVDFFELRFQIAPRFRNLLFGAPLHIIHLRGRDSPGVFDLGVRSPTRLVRLRLCHPPHIFELRAQRFAQLVHLRLGGPLDFFCLPVCGVANLPNLCVRLASHISGRGLRGLPCGLLDRAFALFLGGALNVVDAAARVFLNLCDLRLRFRLATHVRGSAFRGLLCRALALVCEGVLERLDFRRRTRRVFAFDGSGLLQLVRKRRQLAVELHSERGRDPFEHLSEAIVK
jgi:hypothetical protein